ncbi:MAG: peptidase M23 [Pseudomonadota bacterium]
MIRALIFAFAVTGPAAAQDTPRAAADRAAQAMQTASLLLDAADGARDRVAALTEAVRAYEIGLAALRDGIRRSAEGERALKARFEANEAQLAVLIGALMSMQVSPETVTLLHPSGPVSSARADMILGAVTPEIAGQAAGLRRDLEELALIRTLQGNAEIILRRGLADAQDARTALSRAISDRTEPPDPAATDAAAMAALVSGADTLQGFADSLTGLPGENTGDGGFSARKGRVPLPVAGAPITLFNETGADGIARPGWALATAPQALVTAPHGASIRYAGPLLDLGQVVILEPEPGILLVLSGLAEVYGAPGALVEEGAPVGLMGGQIASATQILIESSQGTGQDRPETLYIEIRQGQEPVDPAEWFALVQ